MISDTSPPAAIPFNKYEEMGAYHWLQCNSHSVNFNPPLVARYETVIEEVNKFGMVERILDIGCGDGYLMSKVSQYSSATFGIDSEIQAINLAQKMLKNKSNCKVQNGNCYDLPFESKYFDIVLLTDVIEHLEKSDQCLSEINRVLKTGGKLILTTPKWRPDRKWDHRHVKEYKQEELKELLSDYFNQLTFSFFWPKWWSDKYSTRIGWHLIKYYTRLFYNPFKQESTKNADKYGQLKVICTKSNNG